MVIIMSDRIKTLLKFNIFVFLAALIVSLCSSYRALAEEDNWVHYHGTVTNNGVNVRTGAGTNFDKLQDKDGNNVQLSSQTALIILEDCVADDGKVWYKASFEKSGTTYEGFIFGEFVSKQTSDPITPSPVPATPTPEQMADTAEADTNTEKPIITKTPTPIINAETADSSEDTESGNSKSTILFVIFAIIAIFAAVFIFIIVNSILKQNKKKKKSHTSRKVDRLRREQEDGSNSGNGKRRPEIKRAANEGASVREVRQDVYYTNTESDDDLLGLINQENDDKKSLRAAVDRLQEHDIIIHKIYGEGEVYDNSDVKLMEVRFGNDVRFLNKDSIVSKKLVEVFDDEDQALARRRNKRKTNKR